MYNAFDLTGKVAIVTGVSSGLGIGIAHALAQAGADIVGAARTSCAETKNKVEEAGRRFVEVNADLGKMESISLVTEAALSEFQKIDILVNNAGTVIHNDCLDFNEDDWDSTMNLNLKGYFFLTQAVGRVFFKQGTGGKIINIASMLSYQGGLHVPAYAASKAGVATLTQSFCNEWAGKGINVNAIAPGYMDTRLNTGLQSDPIRSRQILERIPAGRWGTPEDLGGAAVFLASSASDYVNGFTIAVDGGWLAR
ncbi:MAG: 2-dehydro-3-deoxy-D-gluconate 5-dehydrogenase KduD [Oscillospiraceae bacterium]